MLSAQQERAPRAEGDVVIGRPPTGLPPRVPMPSTYQYGAADDETETTPSPSSRQRHSPRSQPPAQHLVAGPASRLNPPEPNVTRPQQADDPAPDAGRATSEHHPPHMIHPDRQASVSAAAISGRSNPAVRALRSDRQVPATASLGNTSDRDPARTRAHQADILARSVLQTAPEIPSARALPSEQQAPAAAILGRGAPAAAILGTASDLSLSTRPRPLVAESLARQRVDARAADVGYFEEGQTQRESRMRQNQTAGAILQSASPEMRLSYEADPIAAWQFDQIRRDDFRTSN